MHGFQLWANLQQLQPARRSIRTSRRDVPEVTDDGGTKVRVIAEASGTGPVRGSPPIRYLDVSVPAGRLKHLPVESTRHAFIRYLSARAHSAIFSATHGTEQVGDRARRQPAWRRNRQPIARAVWRRRGHGRRAMGIGSCSSPESRSKGPSRGGP